MNTQSMCERLRSDCSFASKKTILWRFINLWEGEKKLYTTTITTTTKTHQQLVNFRHLPSSSTCIFFTFLFIMMKPESFTIFNQGNGSPQKSCFYYAEKEDMLPLLRHSWYDKSWRWSYVRSSGLKLGTHVSSFKCRGDIPGRSFTILYSAFTLSTGRDKGICLCTYSFIPSTKICGMSVMKTMECPLLEIHSQIEKINMKLMNNRTCSWWELKTS